MTVQGDGLTPESASSQAITALVVSILGFVTCCLLLSPIGWYLGRQEQKAIREGRSPKAGESLAQIAVVLGIVGTLVMIFFLFWVFFLGGMAVLSALANR
ncbi:MAG TPA: DUF4190 domain-containing protein [Thermoanaerobaculia bacterium]|nr:DUF4190 domain-containing protein [Thermoanaerobaculia bacterium]